MNIFINLFRNTIKTKVFANFLNLSIIQFSNILLMILIYPILTRIIGLENFGKVMVANALAGLLGILVNYGTIQTSIKDVANLKDNKESLSQVFCNTLSIRGLIFIVVAVFLAFSFLLIKEDYLLYLFALPLVLAEVLNPMFFFLGVEKLKLLNITNFVAKIITLGLIILLIKVGEDSIWVNFIMGTVLSFTYLLTILWAYKKYQLNFVLPDKISQILILKGNFYLLVNNFAVHLQQSLMLFALQAVGNAFWLGAYALCDKVIWSTRLLIISLSSSIYPKSTRIYNESFGAWLKFKRNGKYIFGALFFLGSIFIFLFADLILNILTDEANRNAYMYLKQMAFVPFLAALNSMNVLDRLIANDNKSIFNIACILTFISAFCSATLTINKLEGYFGYYPISLELSALILYEIFIKNKYRNKDINV